MPKFRAARATDAAAIAALHADSWRRHYRGAYSDEFLDGDVEADRLQVWNDRLCQRRDGCHTVVAYSDGSLVGFAHTVLGDDPVWGALLDNLHVAFGHQRRGIGTHLLESAARAVIEHTPDSGLYLWVLEQNVPAQRFYEALGARCMERAETPPPGGIPTRLEAHPFRLRYTWPHPEQLLTH